MIERNMYGCLPCPSCGSKYRYPNQQGKVVCADCGLTENYDAYLRHEFQEDDDEESRTCTPET